jgi:D-alanine-D-alanine ligase-like ATP-grasp enzyme
LFLKESTSITVFGVVEMVAAEIEKAGGVGAANYLRTGLDHDIKCCMADVLRASAPKFMRKHGYFDLLGFDFMVSDENKLVLLEVNTNPALSLGR